MSNYKDDQAEGRAAQEAVLAAFVEMGLVPIRTTETADHAEHTDIFLMNPGPEFKVEREGLFVEYKDKPLPMYACIDVKHAAKAPSIEDVKRGRGRFLVEWCSGPKMNSTPLSDENGAATHLAPVLVREDGAWWDRPFYYLFVDHLREFYLKYNDGSGLYITGCRDQVEHWHCALLDAGQFLREYGAAYFYKENGVWECEKLGNKEKLPFQFYILPPFGSIYSPLFQRRRELQAELAKGKHGGLLIDKFTMSKADVATHFFGGNMEPVNACQPAPFNEKYRLKLPSR